MRRPSASSSWPATNACRRVASSFAEYEGNKLIVSVDREDPDDLPLALAYRLAAARVTMARDRDLTVDAAEVRSVTEEAVSCLQQAQAIKSR